MTRVSCASVTVSLELQEHVRQLDRQKRREHCSNCSTWKDKQDKAHLHNEIWILIHLLSLENCWKLPLMSWGLHLITDAPRFRPAPRPPWCPSVPSRPSAPHSLSPALLQVSAHLSPEAAQHQRNCELSRHFTDRLRWVTFLITDADWLFSSKRQTFLCGDKVSFPRASPRLLCASLTRKYTVYNETHTHTPAHTHTHTHTLPSWTTEHGDWRRVRQHVSPSVCLHPDALNTTWTQR